MQRYVITATRDGIDQIDVEVVGPFQSAQVAEARAAALRRAIELADPDDRGAYIEVRVRPLWRGQARLGDVAECFPITIEED